MGPDSVVEPAEPVRFGYMVPEFPITTHVFFERELRALDAMGADVHVVSSRRPPPQKVVHEWADQWMARTTYLWPMSAGELVRGVGTILRAGPRRWARVLAVTLGARRATWRERATALLLTLPAAKLVDWARRHDIRHVHCQFSGSATHTVAIAHELGLPSYSVGAHSVLYLFGGMQREKWRGAAFGTCITEALFADVSAELGDAQPPVWGIAPMGLDVDTYRRHTPYEPYRGSGGLRLFSCGRLNPSKGHDVLIRAVAELRDRGRAVRLRIGGADDRLDGSYEAELAALVRELRLQEEVTLLGAVRQDQVMAELEVAHAFALASWTEGAGVVIMEAMAFALPVVATDVGGVPEVVERDIEGLLVPAGDPVAIADALEVVMDDPERAGDMGRRGRVKAERDFRSERSAELLVRLTRDALRPR